MQKIQSTNITDIWSKVFLIYRQLLAASDKITLKYRTVADTAAEITGTWVSATATTSTFTTTTDLSAYWTSGTGGEVEVVNGVGAGRCAHITSITGSGTYTVVIDEVIPNITTTTFRARVAAWTKITSLLPMTADWSEFPLLSTIGTTWIQLKMHMLFTGKNEVSKVQLVNKPQQLAA